VELPLAVSTWVRPNPFAIGGGAVPSAACAGPVGAAMATVATAATIQATTERHPCGFLVTLCPLVCSVVARRETYRDAMKPR
jgi:hypothetical protein